MEVLYADGRIEGPILEFILYFISPTLLGYISLAAISFILVGLWVPKWKKFAIVTGVLFHIAIDATMYVGTFSYTGTRALCCLS